MHPTILHLVRHGEVHNPLKVLYGRLPRFGLSANGRRQARETALYLADTPLRALFTSPLLRARQTADAIYALHPSLRPRVDARLIEVHTVYEGMPSAQIDRKRGDIYTGVPAPFEQPADIFRRMAGFLSAVRRRFAGEQVAAVSHGDVIIFTVLWALGWELRPENKGRLQEAGYATPYPSHASVTRLTFTTDAPDERPTVDFVQPWR
jgi:broad specificity phosphatase PhoE